MTYEAEKPFVGRTITEVRAMTDEEMLAQGWSRTIHGNPPVLVLDDGTLLFPSKDEEGNGAGALFGTDESGDFRVMGAS